MPNKKIILTALVVSGVLIGISFLFAGPKSPNSNESAKLKKKVAMLEKQIHLMQQGWSGCLQEYEDLMMSCRESCDGKI